MRQFLPNGYDAPRHCDVCGAEESVSTLASQFNETFVGENTPLYIGSVVRENFWNPRQADDDRTDAESGEGFLDSITDYASQWGIDLDRYSERQLRRAQQLEDNTDLSLWGMEDATDDIVSKESMSDNFGTWAESEDPPKMTMKEEMEYLKSFGIFDDVLRDLGFGHLMTKEMPTHD